MSSLIFRITGDPGSFKAAMGEVSSSLDKVGTKSQQVSQRISSLGSSLTLGITLPAIALGTAVVKAASDMEALKKGLQTVSTAADPLEAQLKRLKEVAKLPGLGFSEAIQGSVRLQSAGFSANLAERSLKAFGNALATVGKGKADLDGVSLALSQIASKGKISAEEINQLNERVPQIRAAMKAAFGTADTEVLQKAGIGATEFVTKVVAELEKLKTVSGGTKNSLENLGDTLNEAAVRIGDKLLPSVNAVIPKIEALASGAANVLDGFLALPDPIKNMAIALGTLAVAAGPVAGIVGRVTGAIGGIKAVVGVAGVALGALFGAAVIASIGQTLTSIDKLNARYKDLADEIERRKKGLEDTIKGQENAMIGGVRARGSFAVPELIGAKEGNAATRLGIDLKAINSELNLFGVSAKKTAEPVKALGTAVAKTSNVIKVSSVAGLIYVESLERVKTAVGKVKDVMYEWSIQGTIQGKKLEEQRSAIQGLTFDYGLLGPAIQTALDGLNMMSNIRPPQIEITNTGASRRGSVLEADDILGRAGGSSTRQQSSKVSQLEADLARIKQLNQEGKATGNDVIAVQQALKKAMEETGKVAISSGQKQKVALQQVSLVVNDLAKGITDVIFKGGKMGDMFKNVANQAAQSITRVLIEGALTKLTEKLISVSGLMGKVFGGATTVGGSVFSAAAGGGASTAGKVAGGATSAGGGAGGAASAASGAMGIANLVTGALTAASSIIGNFQFAHMNTALGRIEESTRYTKIWTGEQSQSILWSTQKTAERMLYANTALDGIGRYMSEMLGNIQQINQKGGVGAGGGSTFIFQPTGGYYTSDAALQDLFNDFARYMKAQGK